MHPKSKSDLAEISASARSLPSGDAAIDSPTMDTSAILPVIDAVSSIREFKSGQPCKSLAIVALLHLRPTLVAMVKAWINLGARAEDMLVVSKTYRYPEGDAVRADLQTMGVAVVSVTDLPEAISAFLGRLGEKRFMVVEDGGHVMPLVHDHPRLIGAVEQTTKGVRRCDDTIKKPCKPHLSLPASHFKQRFEPDHVAKAAVKSIERLLAGYADVGSLSVSVIGAAGTIGGRIVDVLASRTRELMVYDWKEPDDFRLRAFGRFKVAGSIDEAIDGRELVVGCTGENTLRAHNLRRLKDGVILASTGSERTEFPVALLESLSEKIEVFRPSSGNVIGAMPHGSVYTLRPWGKRVILLNDGEPVNFSQVAPSEPAVFDLIMATILAGSIELAQGRYTGEVGLARGNVFDKIVKRYALDELFLVNHADMEV